MEKNPFECPVCWECFDDNVYIPSTLPCGHSACQTHLTQLPRSECPICREVFSPRMNFRPNIALRDGAVAYCQLLKSTQKNGKKIQEPPERKSSFACYPLVSPISWPGESKKFKK
jgi:hypothetical protein